MLCDLLVSLLTHRQYKRRLATLSILPHPQTASNSNKIAFTVAKNNYNLEFTKIRAKKLQK
jgi:hypothetical protein